MRVLITADTIGGVWTYTRELVCGLARRGFEVMLVSFGEIPSPAQTEWLAGLPTVEYHPTGFCLEWMQQAEHDLQASTDYLRQAIEQFRPDVLHLGQFCYGALSTTIPKIVVAHSDVVSWWVGVHGTEPTDTEWIRWYRARVKEGLARADAVVAPSNWMLERIVEHYGEPKRSAVICNGRTPHLMNPHMSKELSILSVGRLWDSAKQVSLLAKINSPVPIYIAGAEKHADEAFRGEHDAAGHSWTSSMLHLSGQQSETQLRQLYGRAAIYAATSRYEPFGLAPLEAALSRCAILANDIPSFREIWGEAAYYFKTNDAESLEEAIVCLCGDSRLRQSLANRAYQRALQRYTAERMTEEYVRLYQSLASMKVVAA